MKIGSFALPVELKRCSKENGLPKLRAAGTQPHIISTLLWKDNTCKIFLSVCLLAIDDQGITIGLDGAVILSMDGVIPVIVV